MSRYLLDTTPMTAYLFGRPQALARIGPWAAQHQAVSSIIVYGEIIEYLRGRPNFRDHQRAVRKLFQEIRPYVPTYGVLERYAEIRRALRPTVNLIGDMDTLIAATALERNLTLVTSDSHFQRVPWLTVLVIDRQQFRQ